MTPFRGKSVLVLGLGVSGHAACQLLLRSQARVTAVDEAPAETLQPRLDDLKAAGAALLPGASQLPQTEFDTAVVSPAFGPGHRWLEDLAKRKIPVLSELELGYQHCRCLALAVTGTNGKTTTTAILQHVLALSQIKTKIACGNGVPVSAVADQTRDLDFLLLEVSSFQLEHIQFFRPAVAVVLNITSDHMNRYGGMKDYVLAKARLLENQQPFDWAIIQSEVLARFQTLGIPIRAKTITFSALNRRADIYLDRGLLVSRIEGWTGPLLNMEHCQLRGPHNAENLMAALAVGRVLRVPLNVMRAPLESCTPPAHRCELIAEILGVKYINNSKSTNVDSLHKALLSLPATPNSAPNVWLIAGGRIQAADYHDVGPLLSERVQGALLIGEHREQLRAAWSLFTPCTLKDSLLEALQHAASCASPGDVVLLSPACSSLDQFKSYQHRGDVFRDAVKELARTASAQTIPG